MDRRNDRADAWRAKIVEPREVLERIEPGMSIFLSTGVAEPRLVLRALLESRASNLQDLELVQIASFGEALRPSPTPWTKFRLKTFFAGWVASEAITTGRVDLVPSPFSRIPRLIRNGMMHVDMAVIQISTPDDDGYASLGVSVDAAREAMSAARIRIGEVSGRVPRTLGDTFVHVRDFDALVVSNEEPITWGRWEVDEAMEKVAVNVAALIDDGSCVAFSLGPLFEALSRQLVRKSDLGVHSPLFTDALMDLVQSGAVTNRRKATFRGKCLTSYAMGSRALMDWLDGNPLVEFQSVEVVTAPEQIAQNDGFVAVLSARKIDLTGRVALHFGKSNVALGPVEALELFTGASLSRNGRTVFGLPSRNLRGESNIVLSVEELPNPFPYRELIDDIATEWGIASLTGRTVRERAQAIIDIAHPDDRERLVQIAKDAHLLYPDQIFLADAGQLYPSDLSCTHTFKGGVRVAFRAIKPSDEEEMRRLFYRFSDQAVYYRYFSPITTMPHTKMQTYVNVDYRRTMSIVGVQDDGSGRIIAEGRYVHGKTRPFPDVAFVVDEEYQGRGIATFLFYLLVQAARERGARGFSADVLATNKAMIKVFERSPFPIEARVEAGVYELTIPFDDPKTGASAGGIRFVRA